MAQLGLVMMMGALFMGNLPPGCQPLFGKGRVDDVPGCSVPKKSNEESLKGDPL